VGSTTKSITATAAKVLEESGELSFSDYVDDEDGSQEPNGQRTLRHLLTHQGAFHLDDSAIHLFCYPGDLADFWADPDDLVSPHYDSEPYGNLGGGFEYSAFNYSLAGAYLANRTGESFHHVIRNHVFDPAGMCTAMLDRNRAVNTPIGFEPAVSEGPSMHVGPYINWVSSYDERCEDNFYSSDDIYGDEYDWQYYHLDEAAAEARDPAGGVIASSLDLAHFAVALLESYHGQGGLLSQDGVRELWWATHDYECEPNCPYQPYYAVGFFTNTLPGDPVTEVEHGGSRAGYRSAFVLRPEANRAICLLVNADASTVTMSDLAKTILDDFTN
jgi:CubicO group peptidase (beta-lactamase class C family)